MFKIVQDKETKLIKMHKLQLVMLKIQLKDMRKLKMKIFAVLVDENI